MVALGRDGLDFLSVGELGDAVGHVAVAHVQTLHNDVVVAVVLRSHLDFGELHLIIFCYGVHELLVLHLRDASLRHDDGRRVVVGHDDGTATATLQQTLGVGEHGDELGRTCGSIDDAAHLCHLARMVVDGTVSKLQLHGRHGRDGSLRGAAGLRHIEDVLLRHREVHLHRRVVGDGGQGGRARCAHHGAHLVRQASDDAARRALHVAEAQRLAGRSQCCLGLSDRCLGRLVGIAGRRELVVADDVLLKQFLVVLESQLGGVHLGLCRVHGSLSLAHGSLVSGVVDDEEHLSGTHRLTFLHIHTRDETGHLRTNLYVLHAFDSGGIGGL